VGCVRTATIMPEESPTPRHLNGGLIFIVIFGMIFFVWVLTSDFCNFAQRVRHGKRKNAQKKFEHPPKPVVYYSMNNLRGRLGSTRQVRGLGCNTDSSTNSEGIIEGRLGILGRSDLSPFPLFGGGETRHANAETSLIFGEISEVRQPASFSL